MILHSTASTSQHFLSNLSRLGQSSGIQFFQNLLTEAQTFIQSGILNLKFKI